MKTDNGWKRIRGVRANASCKSHAALDAATELDTGDKTVLADWYKKLGNTLPNLKVFGGCCGTDETHMEAICEKLFVFAALSER